MAADKVDQKSGIDRIDGIDPGLNKLVKKYIKANYLPTLINKLV